MRRSVATVGRVAPHEAWERYAVIARWPSWAPPILAVEASAEQLRAGVTGVVHGPAGLRVSFVVDRVDEAARAWSWRVRSGPLRMALWHEVLPTTDGGTVATLTVQGPWPAALVYPELARVALARLVS
jgi:hypothetical protein